MFRTVRIKDLGKVITGSTPSTNDKDNFGPGFPFIKPPDLSETERSVLTTETEISPKGYETQATRLLPAKSTCVVCIGTIGKIGLTIKPCFTNQQINSVVVDQSQYDPLFVFYLLRTTLPKVKKLNGGSASGRENVNKTAFENIEVQVPHLQRQQCIASILSTYDDLIENNTRRIAILEEMARRIYEEWFVCFRFPGCEQVKLVESELGVIPKGWAWGALRDIAFDVRNGVNPESTDPSTPYVGLEHIPRRSIALSEWGVAADVRSTKLRFARGDILFGKIRPYFHKVAVAPVAGVASSDAIVIRAKEKDWYSLVLGTVSSDAFIAEATQSANGTKMPRANWNVLLGYKVPLPPPDVRNQFNEIIMSMVELIRTTTMKNANLRTTRDLLLPKLISGELDVSALPDPQEAIAA